MTGLLQDLRRNWARILLGILVLPLLYAIHQFNHTLSHEIAEIFSVVVAVAIFLFTWNARCYLENRFYLFIGISFLFVGSMDFIHAMSYEGMFAGDETNIPSQFWYAARYLQAGSLVVAPFFCDRKVKSGTLILAYLLISLLLFGSIAQWKVFPAAYIEGVGVTGFKTGSDYLISLMLLASIGFLYLHRDHFDPGVLRLLYYSILLSVCSEMAFKLYQDYYVYNNLFGHYLKILSFFFFYRALIVTGLFHPYEMLFREIKQNEEALRTARDTLEERVVERTGELQTANLRLEKELLERKRAEEMRQLIHDLLQLTQSVGTIREFLSSLTLFLKDRFRFEAVGIRYRIDGDFPYFAARGFSQDFIEAEISLCSANRAPSRKDFGTGESFYECMCGAVLEGRVDPSLPFFSKGGSFWTNSTTDLLATSREIHQYAPRGRCAQEGYESIALIPLRLGAKTIGLIQLNDRREGQLSPFHLEKLERIAENVSSMLGRMLAQESLEESENRFRSLVEKSTVAILIAQEGRIIFWNPRLEQFFGRITKGLPVREIGKVFPEDAELLEQLCGTTDQTRLDPREVTLRFFSAEEESGVTRMRWFQCGSRMVTFHGRESLMIDMVDISRMKELERIVTVRDKVSLLGQMAAGIAHEIRNPLSGINLNLSTMGHFCRESESMAEEEKQRFQRVLGQAHASSDKIGSVIRSIMEFTKSDTPSLLMIDMNGVIAKAVEFAVQTNRANACEILYSLAMDLPKRRGDPRLLEQVVVNLITNAIQAMEHIDGPRRIEISSSVENGDLVLKVSDSGPGVPLTERERIFDPLYTTRKSGAGIGLSFCHRVILQHGGTLSVGTSPLGGAEFRIDLPTEDGEAAE